MFTSIDYTFYKLHQFTRKSHGVKNSQQYIIFYFFVVIAIRPHHFSLTFYVLVELLDLYGLIRVIKVKLLSLYNISIWKTRKNSRNVGIMARSDLMSIAIVAIVSAISFQQGTCVKKRDRPIDDKKIVPSPKCYMCACVCVCYPKWKLI